jgi:hypothetical protein
MKQQLLNPLSKELLMGSLSRDQEVVVDFVEDRFIFRNPNTVSSAD